MDEFCANGELQFTMCVVQPRIRGTEEKVNAIARDVTDASFTSDVLERSREVPVVVDLWAPWCGPCRALTPVLEKVARDANGNFDLVKINIDENPQVASQLGARSIPLVIAFKDGEPIAKFVGAQPEGAVRKFVNEFVPTEADLLVRDALAAIHDERTGDAETILRAAIRIDGGHEQAHISLAELLADDDRSDEALEALQSAPASPAIDKLRSELRLRAGAATRIDDDLESLVSRGDAEATIALANNLFTSGDIEGALDTLLGAIERHPSLKDGVVKDTLLDIFKAQGGQDPRVRAGRSRLASLIH